MQFYDGLIRIMDPDSVTVSGNVDDVCLISKYAPNKAVNGYPRIQIGDHWYYCHVLAGMVSLGRARHPSDLASHLCHNYRCIRPNHITFEKRDINMSRVSCRVYFGRSPTYQCLHNPMRVPLPKMAESPAST